MSKRLILIDPKGEFVYISGKEVLKLTRDEANKFATDILMASNGSFLRSFEAEVADPCDECFNAIDGSTLVGAKRLCDNCTKRVSEEEQA